MTPIPPGTFARISRANVRSSRIEPNQTESNRIKPLMRLRRYDISKIAGPYERAGRRQFEACSVVSQRVHDHRQFGIAFDKTGIDALRFTHHFDGVEALHDLFPHNAQLHFGQAIAHAAV